MTEQLASFLGIVVSTFNLQCCYSWICLVQSKPVDNVRGCMTGNYPQRPVVFSHVFNEQ